MSLPKEPRQLMINLMYLVLTAMLALNVSSEILHAFRVINQSISKSNASIQQKNAELYSSFDANENMEGQRERVKPFNDKAKMAKAEAQKMYDYLDNWKKRITDESGGYDSEMHQLKREDNIDASTLLFVNNNGGDSLKAKLTELRTSLLNLVSPTVRNDIARQMPLRIDTPMKTDNNPRGDWSTAYFYNMPAAAVITLLSKFQNDVRNSEALVVNDLFSEAASSQVRFDAFKAIAVPRNSYVLAGQKVEADIMLAAFNKALQPRVTASSGQVHTPVEGVASWEGTASGVGLQTVHGTVSIDMNGTPITKDYTFEYMVGTTGASMQLDKMNVFYIGVPNPITVSAAGYSLEDISVSIPGATITPGKERGKYNVEVSKQGEVMASIIAKTPSGPKEISKMQIRVKMIPDPVAEIGGKSSGGMSASLFRAQLGVIANLKYFDFDARFLVTSFQFGVSPKRGDYIGPYTCNSALFSSNADVGKIIGRLKPGDRVFIDEIKAVGPDKRTRTLNPIALLLN